MNDQETEPGTPDSSSGGRRVVAAFDLDKTLTVRDCVAPFVWSLGRRRFVVGVLSNLPVIVAAGLRRDRDRVKAIITRIAFRGRTADEVRERAERFVDRVHPSWIRGDTAARLSWHVEAGHSVVIVSASYEPYVRLLAERFGAVGALATRVEYDRNGRCTGRLEGANCRGTEKVIRLRNWLGADETSSFEIYAYGDSRGDRQLLAIADRPHWIGKNRVSIRPEGQP
jgi:phosphatidylglycerophosphatase C